MKNQTAEKFEEWALVELFGHTQIAGRVSEIQIADQGFIRVDVPTVEGQSGFTKFFGPNAIYAMTPTTEAIVVRLVQNLQVRPIQRFMLELPAGSGYTCAEIQRDFEEQEDELCYGEEPGDEGDEDDEDVEGWEDEG